MSKNRFLLAFSTATVLFVAGQFFTSFFPSPLPAQAQQATDAKKSSSQRWEYAAIPLNNAVQPESGSLSTTRVQLPIYYFQSSGVNQSQIEGVAEGGYRRANRDAISKAIAKLGDEGWEMVGQAPFEYRQDTGADLIYFKRPKQ